MYYYNKCYLRDLSGLYRVSDHFQLSRFLELFFDSDEFFRESAREYLQGVRADLTGLPRETIKKHIDKSLYCNKQYIKFLSEAKKELSNAMESLNKKEIDENNESDNPNDLIAETMKIFKEEDLYQMYISSEHTKTLLKALKDVQNISKNGGVYDLFNEVDTVLTSLIGSRQSISEKLSGLKENNITAMNQDNWDDKEKRIIIKVFIYIILVVACKWYTACLYEKVIRTIIKKWIEKEILECLPTTTA